MGRVKREAREPKLRCLQVNPLVFNSQLGSKDPRVVVRNLVVA